MQDTPVKDGQTETKKFWDDGAGFFGRAYMEGDNSLEGYLTTPMSLEERTRKELDGIVKIMDLRDGQRILDCPCGYGRHTNALAKRGFAMVGVDINSEMLAPAIEGGKGIDNVTYSKTNMLDLAYKDEFDAVLNLFFSFGFFEDEAENYQNLVNFYDALKPAGKFMMHTDINIPRITSGTYKMHEKRKLKSGRTLEIIENYFPETKKLTGQWILLDDDGTRHPCPQYKHTIYTYDDFAQLCKAVGFINIDGYGEWDGSPLTDSSEDMIIVAQKPF